MTIDPRDVTYYTFHQLSIALYEGRILAVGVASEQDIVVLMAGDTVDSDCRHIKNEEVRRLCASR